MIHQGVSFYSYQVAYQAGQLDLEGMVRAVTDLGCDGVELLPVMTPPTSYPKAKDEEIAAWHELMAKYGTKPICLDSLLIPKSADFEEQAALMRDELTLCKQLGFPIMRMPIGPFGRGLRKDVAESLLPMAEELGIILAQEIHAPFTIKGTRVQEQLEWIARTGTKNASLMPDMAIFSSALPERLLKKSIALGADPEDVHRVAQAYAAQDGVEALAEELRAKDGEHLDQLLTFAVNNTPSKISELEEILPYVSGFHGKFYYIEEDYTDRGIRFDEVIPILIKAGWDGYINSEYEGQRMYLPGEKSDELEQVRRQHRMIDRLIAEA